MLYLAWRHGGHDPYRLFHMLDADYSPVGGGPARPPLYPSRLRNVIFGFARLADEEAAKRGI